MERSDFVGYQQSKLRQDDGIRSNRLVSAVRHRHRCEDIHYQCSPEFLRHTTKTGGHRPPGSALAMYWFTGNNCSERYLLLTDPYRVPALYFLTYFFSAIPPVSDP